MGSDSEKPCRRLRKFAPDFISINNVLAQADSSSFPKNNHFTPSVKQVGFMNFDQGDYRLRASSPYKPACSNGQRLDYDSEKLDFAAKTSE